MKIARYRLWISTLLIAGIALRAAAIVVFPAEPISDFKRYYDLATGYALTGSLQEQGLPYISQPPAFPFFLGNVFHFFGASLMTGKLANLALATATLPLFALTVRRMPLNDHARIAAVAIVSLYPGLVTYVAVMGTETLSTFFAVLLLLACTYEGVVAAAAVGVCVGMLALSRPQYLPLIALAAVIPISKRGLKGLRTSGVMAIAFVIVMAPWAIRNWNIYGSPVLVSANGGYVAMVNNNYANTKNAWMPLSSIRIDDHYRDAFVAIGDGYLFEEGGEAEKMARWTPREDRIAFQAAQYWALHHTVDYLRLAVLRVNRAFVSGGVSMLGWPMGEALRHSYVRVTDLLNRIIFALAFVAIAGVAVRRNAVAAFWICAGMLVLTVAATFLFEGQGRYVIPAIPAVAVLAGIAASMAVEAVANLRGVRQAAH